MRLGDDARRAILEGVRSQMEGGTVELLTGESVIATLTIGTGTVDERELAFGPLRSTTARISGTPDTYRVRSVSGALVAEGQTDGVLEISPSSEIEMGAAVHIAGLTYRQPEGSR